jgi:hypothetical protein
VAIGCEARVQDTDVPDLPASPADPIGAIQLALSAVPTDVLCLQVIVEGPPSTRRLFDVSAGQVATFMLTGLAEGEKQVTARAFAQACSDVGPNSVPTWITTESATVFVVPHKTVPLMLVLRPTGTVLATLSFDDSAVSVVPAMADFGSVPVGQSSAASTFTLSDVGKMGTGALMATVIGEDAVNFVITTPPCGSLAPQQMCTLKISFRPISGGPKRAILLLRTETGNTAGVTLTGTGLSPAAFTISPLSHDFGGVTAGTSVSFLFTVTNIGGVPATSVVSEVMATTVGGLGFDVNGCILTSLAAGASCQLEVVAKPLRLTPGTVQGATVTVRSNNGASVSAPVQLTVR